MPSADTGIRLLETARAFRPRLLAGRDRGEADRRVPAELATDLARAGLFRLFLPAAYGGLDLTPVEGMAVLEELARADAAVAWCVWNGNTYWTGSQHPAAAAREVFSGPEVIIANSTQPKGQAAVVDGGYRVSGRWSLVSGCQLADWFQLRCVLHEDGAPRLTPSGAPETRFVFCRAGECRIVDTWTSGALRGTGSHDVVAQDLFVPHHLAASADDPPALTEPRYRFPTRTRAGGGLAAVALGIARGALEALVELGSAKRPEGSARPLAEDPGAQARLAQAEALVASGRLFAFDAVGQLWDAVGAGGAPSALGQARVGLAMHHAVASAVQAVDLAYLTGGATSLYTSCPLERAFRDVHAVTQHIAVHPRGLESIGRLLFGVAPEPGA